MKKTLFAGLAVLLAASAGASFAHAGKIVLANDEWTLSNSGYSSSNDPDQFVKNVLSWFSGSVSGGNYLAYSNNFGLTGSSLQTSVVTSGNTWTVSMPATFDLALLNQYDAVFLAGNPVDNQVLINYVNGGGNVYLAGGTGWGGALNEATQWNTFLNAFDLGFGTSYNLVGGDIAITSSHPLFDKVDHLYQNNGNDALDINILDPKGQVLVSSQNGQGLYAIYDSGSNAVPEPATMLLFGTGIAGLAAVGRRKRN